MKKIFNYQSINLILLSIGIIMLGFSYGSVPLYKLYCRTVGLGGLENSPVEESLRNNVSSKNEARSLIINFESEVSQDME